MTNPTPKKLLIVEDEADISTILSKRLMTAGYKVMMVPDATTAIREVRGFAPNLIILDWMLPGGGGPSVLKSLKLSTKTNLIPILVLTGVKGADIKDRVLGLGADAFMEKPYQVETLLSTIASLAA